MAEYDNTNRGAMFKNDRKEDGDNRPDYTGKLELGDDVIEAARNGNPIYISGWIKRIQKGEREGQNMLSLAVQPPKNDRGGRGGKGDSKERSSRGSNRDRDDDIPF